MSLMKRIGTSVSFFALAATASVATAEGANPVLTSKQYFTEEGVSTSTDLILTEMDLDIAFDAGFAETTAIMTFRNPTNQQLEGEFVFDMPKGATLIGYGLDINGSLRDGVIVEKKAAERAFNERIRRGVDPGLAEVTRTNAFKTRVFPIFGGSERTISVTFITPVSEDNPYVLPLATDQALDVFGFSVTGIVEADDISLKGVPEVAFDASTGEAKLETENLKLDTILSINTPPTQQVSTQRHQSGQAFVGIQLPLDDTSRAYAPESVRVYWDTSLSAEDSAKKSLDFLTHVLDDTRPFSLELVTFSAGEEQKRRKQLRPQPDELAFEVDALTYNGGTDLETLFETEQGTQAADVCFLVTDGRSTVGNAPTERLPCQLHIISSADDADTALLGYLARQGGGHYLNMANTSVTSARNQLDRALPDVQTFQIDGQSHIDELEWRTDAGGIRLFAPVAIDARNLTLEIDGNRITAPLNPARAPRADSLGANWAALKLISERVRGASRGKISRDI